MKKRHFILISIVALMTTVWLVILVLPTQEEHSIIRSNLFTARTQINDFQNIMIIAPEYFKNHKKIKKQQLQLSSQLYSKENILSLFDELELRAENSNLKVIEFTPSVEELLRINHQVPDENKPQTLNIVITLSGQLKDIGKFVKGVEAENFYQGVEYCQITNSLDGEINSNFIYGIKAVLGAIRKP